MFDFVSETASGLPFGNYRCGGGGDVCCHALIVAFFSEGCKNFLHKK
jgi:hypothetical protein